MQRKLLLTGIAFAFLWASASTATKIALVSGQPFVISVCRFFFASAIMLFITHVIMKQRPPQRAEWRYIMFYGLLNVSIYLGLYIIALQKVSAGLGTLAVGVNPVIISFMAALFFKQKITRMGMLSLTCCLLGVTIAAWPLLKTSYASLDGLLLIGVSMLAYSGAAIFYARHNWKGLHILTINGWQTLFGGIFILPCLFYTYDGTKNHFDGHFWAGTLWLAMPVSIAAVHCWLLLLKHNPAKAAYWLFLCPLFGFTLAALLLKEPLSFYTAAGVMFVIGGLYIAQKYPVAVKKYVDATTV